MQPALYPLSLYHLQKNTIWPLRGGQRQTGKHTGWGWHNKRGQSVAHNSPQRTLSKQPKQGWPQGNRPGAPAGTSPRRLEILMLNKIFQLENKVSFFSDSKHTRQNSSHRPPGYNFFFFFLNLAAPSLSCSLQGLHRKYGIFSCRIWDLVPWPGIEPVSAASEGEFLTTGPPRKSHSTLFSHLFQ